MPFAKPSLAHVTCIATLFGHLAGCATDLAVDPGEHAALTALSASATTASATIDGDIAARLAAIDGLDEIEVPEEAPPGYRFFQLGYRQPVDHENPEGPWFSQQMALLHRSDDAPMILNLQGYALYGGYVHEPTRLVAGNQLSVEHRYYGASWPGDPENVDWRYLDIVQAAADHHRIVEAIKPLYRGAWISTGASKGGMTSLYHHRFYPGDVDGTIPYVAPITFGMEDQRYFTFLQHVGDADCRRDLKALQREALLRRDRLVPTIEYLAALYGTGFTRMPGGADAALDVAVAEFGFQFWQYGHESYCDDLPALDASDLDFINLLAPTLYYATDLGIDYYYSYYYQSMTELGSPLLPIGHLRDLLHVNPNDYTLYTGDMAVPDNDTGAMVDIAYWARFEAENVLYIYGEIDPWTAGAFPAPPNGARDNHLFVAPGGNHLAEIADLADADRAAAYAVLESWTGVAVAPATEQRLMAGPDIEKARDRAMRGLAPRGFFANTAR